MVVGIEYILGNLTERSAFFPEIYNDANTA
jgi:hypothetical protein